MLTDGCEVLVLVVGSMMTAGEGTVIAPADSPAMPPLLLPSTAICVRSYMHSSALQYERIAHRGKLNLVNGIYDTEISVAVTGLK